MNKRNIFFLFLSISYLWLSEAGNAQSKITFQLNLKPQIQDSTFIPSRDQVQIIGSFRPLQFNMPLELTDTNRDSIYTITLDFGMASLNQNLNFNYQLVLNKDMDRNVLKESMPRTFILRQGEFKLDPLYFDSFAW